MKSIEKLKYILLGLIILGFFANIAQNDYGMRIVLWSLISISLVFLSETVYYGLKEKPPFPLEKPFPKVKIIGGIIGILAAFFILFFGPFGDGGLINFLVGFIFLVSSIALLIQIFSRIKPMFIESFSLFIYSTSFMFKMNHYAGASILMVLSSLFLICYFTIISIRFFVREKRMNIRAAGLFQILFLFIIMSLIGSVFKMQHWTGADIVVLSTMSLSIIVLVCLLFNLKFKYPSGKISLLKMIGSIKGNFSLLFIFYVLTAIHLLLFRANIAPSFYSDNKPIAMIRLSDNNKERRYEEFNKAYSNFLLHRREIEDKEK